LEFENSKYEFPSPDPYRQKEMLLPSTISSSSSFETEPVN
jgi:hypothetical protein